MIKRNFCNASKIGVIVAIMSNNDEKYTYTPVSKLEDALPLWFCFPCEYTIGMSALGYLHLFRLLDENPKVAPERIFTDTNKTFHKAQDIKLFGFSYSFEFDFQNIFKVLDTYKIPLKSAQRDNSQPLVFAGGPVITANPEPYADFFDFLIIGDGEDVIQKIVDIAYGNKDSSDKQKILLELSAVEGIYVPSFYKPEYGDDLKIKSISKLVDDAPDKISRTIATDLSAPVCTPIVTENTMFAGTYLVEVARGCPKRCGFCLASYSNLPSRYPDIEQIKKSILVGLESANKVGLLGALIQAHPQFDQLCEFLSDLREEKDFEVSVASLRADRITPEIVSMLVKCGQRTATIAIEAGSERLRRAINKDLSDEQIFESVKIARENGLSGLKIYGMIGLPTETDTDIKSFVELMKNLKVQNKQFSLTLSVSSFVPKAQTPFQWYGRDDYKTLSDKSNYLKKELHKIGVKFRPTSPKWDYLQAVLSMGDRRIAPLLEQLYAMETSYGVWRRIYKELKSQNPSMPDFDWYAIRNKSDDEILPWALIDSGISNEKLINERKRLSLL